MIDKWIEIILIFLTWLMILNYAQIKCSFLFQIETHVKLLFAFTLEAIRADLISWNVMNYKNLCNLF